MSARCCAGWSLALGILLLTAQTVGAQTSGEVANPPAFVRTLNQAAVYRTPASSAMQIGFVHMGARCRVLKAIRVAKTLWYQVRWDQGGVSFARDYDGGSGSGSGYIQSIATDRPTLPDSVPDKAAPSKPAPSTPVPAKPTPKDREKPPEKALAPSYLRPIVTFGSQYRVVEERYDPDARRYRWVLEATENFSEAPSFTGEFQDDAGESVRKITLRFESIGGYTEKGKRLRASLPYPSEATLARVRRIVVTKSRL